MVRDYWPKKKGFKQHRRATARAIIITSHGACAFDTHAVAGGASQLVVFIRFNWNLTMNAKRGLTRLADIVLTKINAAIVPRRFTLCPSINSIGISIFRAKRF